MAEIGAGYLVDEFMGIGSSGIQTGVMEELQLYDPRDPSAREGAESSLGILALIGDVSPDVADEILDTFFPKI